MLSPLHSFAKSGDVLAVKELIKSGENVDDVDQVCIQTCTHGYNAYMHILYAL